MAATLTGELAALMLQVNDPSNQIVAHLGKNAIDSSVDYIDPTSLVECDFPGYEPIRLTDWTPIFIDDDNYGEADSGEVEWEAGNITTPQTITCVWVTNTPTGGTPVIWNVIVLDEPVTLINSGDLFWFSFRAQSANIDAIPDDGEDV